MGVVDKNGDYFEDVADVIENSDILKEYAIAQYNNLFDYNHRLDKMFID